MTIDMASVYAAKYRKTPNVLRAAVMGQSPDKGLDSYTALNALKLVKEADMMAMSGVAQQPTSSPSLVAQNMAPNPMQQGLGAMVPGAMGQAPQGMAPQQRAPMPQPTMQAASGGLAGMYTPEEDYAAGGIVAFNGEDGSYVGGELTVPPGTEYDPNETGLYPEELTGGGTGAQRAQASDNVQETRRMIMGMNDEGMSQAEFNRIRQDSLDFAKRNAGPDIYEPANRRLREREEARSKNVSQGQGLALLAAAGAILEGNTLARGASKAFPVFAQQMGEVQRADIAEQRSIENMQFSLADAQRKERMGDIRGAQAAAETARKEKADANRFKLNKAQALARLDADVYKAVNRPNKNAGAGLKYQEQILQNNVDYFKSTLQPKQGETPEAFDARVRKTASDETARALKTSFSTGEIGALKAETALEPVKSRENIEANKALDRHKLMYRKDWRKAVDEAGSEQAATAKFKADWIRNNPQAAEGEAAPAKSTASKPAATSKPAAASKPTTATKVVSMADIDATVASSGRTKQEVMDALKAKGYTVK
jgi:hypothetical protein